MSTSDLTAVPASDPIEILRLRDGLYAVDMLAAAVVGLDFFSWLAERGGADLPTVCAGLQLHERPADVMLTLFTAMGLLKRKAGSLELTPEAREYLVKDSPWFLGPYYASLKDRPVTQDILVVLRTGKPSTWGSLKNEKAWAKAMEDDGFARQFTAAMDCRGVFLGQALARQLDLRDRTRLLDVAGGSGIYACTLVAHHPHLRAAVLEKTPVDQVARNAIAERGFAGRVDVVVGDMFADALPAGFDAHLFSNVLHDWDVPRVEALLAKSAAALPEDGLIIIHGAHLNREKTGPLPVAAYSALLMTVTEGKCYSVGELETYLGAAGFDGVQYIPTAGDRSAVTGRKRRSS
jgi:predicted O-methyltransferase YrrM